MKRLFPGGLSVICGPMFSGKTERLIKIAVRLQSRNIKTHVFKPIIDTRYGLEVIASHSNLQFHADPIDTPCQVLQMINTDTQTVIIDEAQFFGFDIIDVCNRLTSLGIEVIIAGLDQDFRGEPFGPMHLLMALAEDVTKLASKCTICGMSAGKSQRLINGQPANYDSPTVIIGTSDTYEPRCRVHHIIESP